MPGFVISEVPFPPAPTPCPDGVGPKVPLNADVEEPSVSCGATASRYPRSIWGVKPGDGTHYTSCWRGGLVLELVSRHLEAETFQERLGWAQHE